MQNMLSWPRGRSSVVKGLAVAVVIGVIASWWVVRDDERRVNAACGTYLGFRDSLRSVLSETQEADERAVEQRATRTSDRYFNDADAVQFRMDQWLRQSPAIIAGLDASGDATGIDRTARQSFEWLAEGLVELQRLLNESGPEEVDSWLLEVQARMQGIDDTCLFAARSRWT